MSEQEKKRHFLGGLTNGKNQHGKNGGWFGRNLLLLKPKAVYH